MSYNTTLHGVLTGSCDYYLLQNTILRTSGLYGNDDDFIITITIIAIIMLCVWISSGRSDVRAQAISRKPPYMS